MFHPVVTKGKWVVGPARWSGILLIFGLFVSTLAGAQSILTAGAKAPFKLARTPGGNFVLAEGGTGAGDGRVSLLSVWGNRFRLLDGLPSAPAFGEPIGPTGIAQAHRTLFVVLGSGDAVVEGAPPTQAPNPAGASSPIFSSVLRARFDPVPDAIREGFELTPADLRALADGNEVVLDNDSNERVELFLLNDFRDFEQDPFTVVRPANPFAAEVVGTLTTEDLVELGLPGASVSAANFLARLVPESALGQRLEERSTLYVIDASMNTVNAMNVATGHSRVVVRFPPLPNLLFPNLGGPVVDSVPTGVFVRADGDLLVSLLSGFPFAATAASVLLVHPETGVFEPYVAGLTTVTDMVEVGGALYVLELSTDFLKGAPGRILRFASANAAPTVLAGGLIGATGLEHDPFRNELIVSETFTGRIVRVPLQ